MLKKNVIASMVGALLLSTNGALFAMEAEDKDEKAQESVFFFRQAIPDAKDKTVPDELQKYALSFCPAENLCSVSGTSKYLAQLVRNTPSLIAEVREKKAHAFFVKKRTKKERTTQEIIENEFGDVGNVGRQDLGEDFVEHIMARLNKALQKHYEYGFTDEFSENRFKKPNFELHGIKMRSFFEINWVFLPILAIQFGEEPESSPVLEKQRIWLRQELTALFEKHPGFQNNEKKDNEQMDSSYSIVSLPNYKTHFETIFRFLKGMSEEQQTTTISLLSPHVECENFLNFYPRQLVKGMAKYNVSNLNGAQKIHWLGNKLESCGFYPKTN